MPIHASARGNGARGSKELFSLLLFAVVIALAFGTACSDKGASTAAASGGAGAPGKGGRGGRGGGDVPVLVAKASQKNVPVEVQVIGNVEAYSTISVKAQVTGQLTNVYFHEGDFVKKDALLFTIDPRPLEAALNQSQANLAKDEASLGQAQANLARDRAQARYAESQATRYQQLYDQKIISKDQAEQLRSNADAVAQAVQADLATIESMKASIGASKAAVENARVQLGYTKIYSPITGRTGNLTVKQGNVVMANNMELMTINEIEPIYVTFAVPESQLTAIKTYMAQGKLPVRAKPQDDDSAEETGTLTFVDNTVDVTTGTIKLKGTFPNVDHKLWPGQFVRVTLKLTTQRDAITVPNEAVQTGQSGSFVYVVKDDRSVESRPVKVGARVENDMVIDSGLEAGETVVTEGQLRLAPGSHVVVRDGRGGPGRGRRGEGGGQGGQGQGGQGHGEGRGEGGGASQEHQKG